VAYSPKYFIEVKKGFDEKPRIPVFPPAARKDPKTVIGAFGDVSQGDTEL
jgi:hypothetical protein